MAPASTPALGALMREYRGEGFDLEEWREPEHGVRIAVDAWRPLCPVEDQFIERPRSLRFVWPYLKQVGPLAVWRKIRSRLAEADRNRKVAAVGRGRIVDAPAGSPWRPGARVAFFAPNHRSGCASICVDERFVVPAERARAAAGPAPPPDVPSDLAPYVGWSPFSGVPVDGPKIAEGVQRAAAALGPAPADNGATEPAPGRAVDRIVPAPPPLLRAGRPTAVLFGLGNYAKTQIVPIVRRRLDLRCVHEIDPAQLRVASRWPVVLDTAPEPREDERYDAWFIAGYHHTHAALALRAVREGAYAVVEKPLATSREQFEALRSALDREAGPRLFTCFQKRYSKLDEWARADLGVSAGEPVDMHCIVFEIPLPRRHWYNWPNSGSRIVSNGCHWLDYFLFVNDYSPTAEAGSWSARGSDLAAFVRLDNGATLVLSLTDTGSSRLGVRDLIELRAGSVTVRMTDASAYEAERTARFLRRRRVNPMDAYGRMYRSICGRILRREPGDDSKTLRSTELMLGLEDEFRSRRKR